MSLVHLYMTHEASTQNTITKSIKVARLKHESKSMSVLDSDLYGGGLEEGDLVLPGEL